MKAGPLLLLCWIIVAAGLATAEKASGDPQLDLHQALDIAEAQLREAGVELSGMRLQAALLDYDDGSRVYPDGKKRRGPFWYIHWGWSQPRLGGDISVRVFMDGDAVVERHGP
jgi:hypothetical protein